VGLHHSSHLYTVEDLPSFALLPLDLREDMGIMKIFDALPIGYQTFSQVEHNCGCVQWLTILLLFLAMIGWRTRVVVPLGTLCVLVLNGILREYSGFWHQNMIPIMFWLSYRLRLAAMAGLSTGCGRFLVVILYQILKELHRYMVGLERYACWVAIALPYVTAGLTKLRAAGIDWMSVTNMKNMLFEQTLYPRAGNWSISLSLASAPDHCLGRVGHCRLCRRGHDDIAAFSRIARRIISCINDFHAHRYCFPNEHCFPRPYADPAGFL